MRCLISSVTCGNDLHRLAEIIAAPFLGQDRLVNLAGGEVVLAGQLARGEALVVAEIEIGLRAVLQHIDFAVLIRAHRARIDIEIGIELLQYDFQPAMFQECAEGRRRETLPRELTTPPVTKIYFIFFCS